MRLAKSRVHFIGIGGIGMCGLAELLHNMGVQVRGSDISENQQTIRLREMGIKVLIGHREENIEDVDVCVFSSAVKPSNVEFATAKKKHIPLIPRAEALAEIMRLKRGVAVGGSHGKTTTTSMTAAIFLHAKFDPTIVVGGRLDLIKSTAKLGSSDWLVAEADESDGSFNRLSPEIVIITNIDNDHLDHYKTFSNLQNAFYEFASRVPFYGVAIVCGDDKATRDLFKDFPKRIIFYGFKDDNEYVLRGEKSRFEVVHNTTDGREESLGEFRLSVPGRHNGLNALAAILSAKLAGVPMDKCLKGIETFAGVDRRMQKKYDIKGVFFYDDYGHHPTEIAAVMQAFQEQMSEHRLHVLFQPHRYSRTQSCWKDFLTCFKGAAEVHLLDIYPAGEAPIKDVTSKRLAEEMDHASCHYYTSKEEAKDEIVKKLKAGDILLTLGAGDVYKLGDDIARRL
jgi:UDP-N-acetylmuramate--alanine ligase